ncbi:DUF4197 domain-containing protein [soil metagenome]
MKTFITGILLLLSIQFSFAQKDSSLNVQGLFKKAGNLIPQKSQTGSGLSSEEIVAGLKEALSLGAQKSGDRLSAPDGFFKDAAVKILLPPEVTSAEKKMRMLGMGKLVDNAVLSMNRAAEDASKAAAPIFLNAIKTMTVTDALNILRGTDTAATAFLRHSTSPALFQAFLPVVEEALQKANATKYWKDFFSAYNKVSTTPVDTDVNNYVTARAINGIFYYVAKEEESIRKNPAERVTGILKKVFGSD